MNQSSGGRIAWALVAILVADDVYLKMNRRTRLVLAGIAVALAWRAVLVPAVTANFDGDNAVIGLMARHVLQGHFPVFFWGQDYMGTLEVYLASAAFALFGSSPETLSLALLGFTAVTVWLTWWLARRWFGEAAGWSALVLAAAGTPIVCFFSVAARGGYASLLALGLATLAAADRAAERPTVWRGLLLGSIVGLSFWTTWLTAPFLAVSAAIVLAGGHGVWRPPFLATVAAGFLLGSAPFWIYNASAGFPTFAFLESRTTGRRESLVYALRTAVPQVLGLLPLSGRPTLPIGVLGALAAVGAMGAIGAGHGRERGRFAWLWIVLLGGVSVIAYAASASGKFHIARYLLPVAVPAWLSLAAVAALVARRSRAATVALVGGVVLLLVGRTVSETRRLWEVSERSERAGAERILEVARAKGIDSGYAPYGIAMLVTFLSNEEVLFLDYHRSRYPLDRLQRFSDPALVNDTETRTAWKIRDTLAAIGARASRRDAGRWELFWPIDGDGIGRTPIAWPDETRVRVSRGDEARAVLDGSIDTFWATRGAQAAGDWIEIELPSSRRVAGVQIFTGRRRYDYPRRFVVETRDGRGEWQLVRSVRWGFPLAFAGDEVVVMDDDHAQVLFPTVRTGALRIRLVEGHPIYDWSVAELTVYEPTPGVGLEPPAFWTPEAGGGGVVATSDRRG